jgi:hypothetical protein
MRFFKMLMLAAASVLLSTLFFFTGGGLPIRQENISSTLGPGTYEVPFVVGIDTWAICPLRREGETFYRLSLMHGMGVRMYTPYFGALTVTANPPKAKKSQTP